MEAVKVLLFVVLAYMCTTGVLSQSLKCGSCTNSFCQSCYQVIEENNNWADARAICQALHPAAYLAEISSIEENAFLNTTVDFAKPTWLGGTDAVTEGQWKWDHSGASITNFFGNQNVPVHATHLNCLLAHLGGWSDADCNFAFAHAVCEFPCNPCNDAEVHQEITFPEDNDFYVVSVLHANHPARDAFRGSGRQVAIPHCNCYNIYPDTVGKLLKICAGTKLADSVSFLYKKRNTGWRQVDMIVDPEGDKVCWMPDPHAVPNVVAMRICYTSAGDSNVLLKAVYVSMCVHQ